MSAAPRTVLVWCPDWPVVAAAMAESVSADRPVAVVAGQRVLACSAPARSAGVRRGLRRREAQARCPGLVVLPADPDRDARLFEPVAAAVEEIAPGVEILRPGMVALAARGPTRYFGGEQAVAERLVDHIADRVGVECQVGIADGVFTAALAAHRGALVEPGGAAAFLAPLPIADLCRDPGLDDTPAAPAALARTELVDLLLRLGIGTLGAFAALPATSVGSRFGADAVLAHRLAAGIVERPAGRRRPPVDLVVTLDLDPPVDRVDAAAFAARTAATALTALLVDHGLACTRLGIQAVTEAVAGGERTELARVWRCAEPLTAAATADRVRWQLEGWLTARSRERHRDPSRDGPIVSLRLVPEEVVPAGALQLGLWGETGESDARAARALTRVQTLLGGADSVLTAVPDGGRSLLDRIRLVPWGEQRVPVRDPTLPWAGRLSAPSPALVLSEHVEVRLLDAEGDVVEVDERQCLRSPPVTVCTIGRWPGSEPGSDRGSGSGSAPGLGAGLGAVVGAWPAGTVTWTVIRWAGPWVVAERWWDPGHGDACARVQAVLVDSAPSGAPVLRMSAVRPTTGVSVVGRRDDVRPVVGRSAGAAPPGTALAAAGGAPAAETAVLLVRRHERWWIEAIYD